MAELTSILQSTIEADLRTLDEELIWAQKSWIFFERSTKHFSPDQEALSSRIIEQGIHEPYWHLQDVALRDVAVTLCRMFDNAGPDKISFKQAIKQMISGCTGTREQQLRELDSIREEIFTSGEFRELKAYRDAYIGHRLKMKAEATYKFIPNILARTSDLLQRLFGLSEYRQWRGGPTPHGIDKRAELLISTLENKNKKGNEQMFSHMMVGSDDLDKSKSFYDALFTSVGGKEGIMDPKGRLVYIHNGAVFLVTKPIDGNPCTHGNGMTIGFAMDSTEQADTWHAAGAAAGGTPIEDAPGWREGGGQRLYLAYLRDPDGNKLCALHRG